MKVSRNEQKLWLILKKDILSDRNIKRYKTLLYDKIYILSDQCKKNYTDWKITVVGCKDSIAWIQSIYKLDRGKTSLIPFFFWDVLAKHSIDIYNHTFSTKVKYPYFKDKNAINHIIQSACKKQFMHYTFDQLQQIRYQDIAKIWLEKFIIKPQSGSSSFMTFLVENSKDFTTIKKKLSPKHTYILEEYFYGELNSVDFYNDGKNLYILAYIKEKALKDLSTGNQLSEDFLHTYKKDLKLFNFLIPVRYNESFEKITHEEFRFLSKIQDILTKLHYRWFIHLEYKFNASTHTIGFVERWARLGFKRKTFIEKAYTTGIKALNLPYLILHDKLQWFTTVAPWLYILKESNTNTNILWMRTSFYKKTNKKFTTIESFKDALSRFLRTYFSKTFDIQVMDIQYVIKYKEWNVFYPFYQCNDTRLDYLLFFNDKDFLIVKKNIGKIVERLVFNDFTVK